LHLWDRSNPRLLGRRPRRAPRARRGAMNQLVAKLEALAEETGDEKKGPNKQSGGDEFKRIHGGIAVQCRDIRKALKERDELMQKGGSGSKQTVQISNRIRQQIKVVREDANKLHALQRKEAAKRGKGNAQQVEARGEQVDLVFRHIEECEALDKRRYASKNSEARVELFSGGKTGTLVSTVGAVSRVPEGTELPPLEVQDGLRQLQIKDQRIDEELEQVAAGVADLRSVALDIRDEVKVQNAMVDEITHKVDKAHRQLTNVNKKMKKTLEQTRSADRFILDFILLVVLLGIIGYIITMF